jgi:Flp pilus assembly protein TadD
MTRWLVPAAIVLVALTGCSASAPGGLSAKEQMRFGVEAGRRGYWQEALFRFERALAQQPADAELLNNLAVTQEALGRFDDALATYKEALKQGPKNQHIRRNYARFAEFYSSYARGIRPKAESHETR